MKGVNNNNTYIYNYIYIRLKNGNSYISLTEKWEKIEKQNLAEVGQIFKNCHTSDKQVINARFYTNA